MRQVQSSIPAPNSPLVDDGGRKISVVWHQYFYNQHQGIFPQRYAPVNEPDAPANGFITYCDVNDGSLKIKDSNGNVTVLANKGEKKA